MVASQRKYICSFCAKAFSRSEHRTRHERSHTGVKPFGCKVCSQSFVRRDLLQRHIRTVHRNVLMEFQLERDKKGDITRPLRSHQMEEILSFFIDVNSREQCDEYRASPSAARTNPRHLGTVTSTKMPARPDNVESMDAASRLCAGFSIRDGDEESISSDRGTFSRECFTDSYIFNPPGWWNEIIYKEVSLVSDDLKRGGAERVGQIIRIGLDYVVQKGLFINTLRMALAACINQSLQLSGIKTVPLLYALVFIGCWVNHGYKQTELFGLWKFVWAKCDKGAQRSDFLAMSLLVHVLLVDSSSCTTYPVDISGRYQEVLFQITQRGELVVFANHECWRLFHYFVDLAARSNGFNGMAQTLYGWFLEQNLHGRTLRQWQDELAHSREILPSRFVLETIARSLLCEVVLGGGSHTGFHCPELLHNTIIMVNKCYSKYWQPTADVCKQSTRQYILQDSPQKFVYMLAQYLCFSNTEDQWSLLLATWLDFVRGISAGTFQPGVVCKAPRPINLVWFYNNPSTYSAAGFLTDLDEVEIDIKSLNNNLAICTLPLLCSLEKDLGNFVQELGMQRKLIVFDVLVFNSYLFGNVIFLRDALVSPTKIYNALTMLENPIVQVLLFVWYRFLTMNCMKSTDMIGSPHVQSYPPSNIDISYAKEFLNRYINISKIKVDTDVLIKNDADLILFGKGEDPTVFYGLHVLLAAILERIEQYIRVLFPSGDLHECGLTTSTIENAIKGISTTRYNILAKISRKTTMIDMPSETTPRDVNRQQKSSLQSLARVNVQQTEYHPTAAFFGDPAGKIILPPINLPSFPSNSTNFRQIHSNPLDNGHTMDGAQKDNAQQLNCKIQLPLPTRFFNNPSTL